MLTILLRTLIIYGSLILIMRFMGKRQLGELEITDLATALLISEIASLPMTDPEIPISHALLPVATLAALEVCLSALQLKLPVLKRMMIPRPTVLILHGVPDRGAMSRARISAEELMSQLRLNGVSDPSDVAFALLEPNGQISVISKEGNESTDIMRLIVSDGRISKENLRMVGRDQSWLSDYLKQEGVRAREVFMLLTDGQEKTRLYRKRDKPPKKKQGPA